MQNVSRPPQIQRCVFIAALAINVAVLLLSSVSVAIGAELPAAAPEQDRKAILAMAGEHEVTFDFRETASLSPGYQTTDPYTEHATEAVIVIDNQPDRITLQHILVMGGPGRERVIKHWRQDWRYEPTHTFQYVGPDEHGNPLWQRRELSAAESRGKWVQEVYQVDDMPRYASLGSWQHLTAHSVVGSTWEGEVTRRPLPRREYTTRSDYTVLTAINRHIITQGGWLHEQQNLKQISTPDGTITTTLARELGNNTYARISKDDPHTSPHTPPHTPKINFQPGYDTWAATAAFWADVRAAWRPILFDQPSLRVSLKLEGKPLHDHFADYAKKIQAAGTYDPTVGRQFIQHTLSRYLLPTAAAPAAKPAPTLAAPQAASRQ